MGRLTRSIVLLGILVALATTGCSNDETPAPDDAGRTLAAWMGKTGDVLTDGVAPLQPWAATNTADTDEKGGCKDGAVRRTYVATAAVPDSKAPDPGLRGNLLVGQLGNAGWDAEPARTTGDGGSITAARSDADPSGTRLTLTYSAVTGGWSYAVTARTGCLATG